MLVNLKSNKITNVFRVLLAVFHVSYSLFFLIILKIVQKKESNKINLKGRNPNLEKFTQDLHGIQGKVSVGMISQ